MFFRSSLLPSAGFLALASIASAGPNADGVILLHTEPDVSFTDGGTYCELADVVPLTICFEANARTDETEPILFWVFAAFPVESNPRLSGVTLGIEYPAEVTIIDDEACGDFVLSDNEWPASGHGTAVTWNEAQTTHVTVIYGFVGYGASGGHFELTPNPNGGGVFADDSIPSLVDPIADYGVLGFGTEGYVPCSDDMVRACCFDDRTCELLGENDCSNAGGSFLPDEFACDPNPCEPVPVVGTSWGRMKSQYR